jgi:hypothetical protein
MMSVSDFRSGIPQKHFHQLGERIGFHLLHHLALVCFHSNLTVRSSAQAIGDTEHMVGHKAGYRTRMALANGAQLLILPLTPIKTRIMHCVL